MFGEKVAKPSTKDTFKDFGNSGQKGYGSIIGYVSYDSCFVDWNYGSNFELLGKYSLG